MDIKQRIEIAKLNVRKAETAKITAEANKAQAEKQQADIVEKMQAEGVSPETINDEIGRLEAQVEADLATVESLIPRV